jgi:hypothetical protein
MIMRFFNLLHIHIYLHVGSVQKPYDHRITMKSNNNVTAIRGCKILAFTMSIRGRLACVSMICTVVGCFEPYSCLAGSRA